VNFTKWLWNLVGATVFAASLLNKKREMLSHKNTSPRRGCSSPGRLAKKKRGEQVLANHRRKKRPFRPEVQQREFKSPGPRKRLHRRALRQEKGACKFRADRQRSVAYVAQKKKSPGSFRPTDVAKKLSGAPQRKKKRVQVTQNSTITGNQMKKGGADVPHKKKIPRVLDRSKKMRTCWNPRKGYVRYIHGMKKSVLVHGRA